MKIYIYIILILSIFIGCNSNDLTPSITLEGDWVEINSETDTLTFSLLGEGKP